jgi:Macrocin-O-methyltransferase (TylF)
MYKGRARCGPYLPPSEKSFLFKATRLQTQVATTIGSLGTLSRLACGAAGPVFLCVQRMFMETRLARYGLPIHLRGYQNQTAAIIRMKATSTGFKVNFSRYGLLDERVRVYKGWFRETLPTAPMNDWQSCGWMGYVIIHYGRSRKPDRDAMPTERYELLVVYSSLRGVALHRRYRGRRGI